MARISFSDADQMAMQAKLQADLNRINRKKRAEAKAEKPAAASAAEENKEKNSPSPTTTVATEEKPTEAVIASKGAAAASAESDEERQAREQRELTEAYKKARVRCGLEAPPPSASIAQPQQPAASSASAATVVPSTEAAEEKKKVVSAAAPPFFRAPFEALEAEIGNAEKIVFLYLYASAKEKECVANASLREISIKTHMAKTTVKKALGVLRDCAWIGWDKMTEENGRIAKNNYSILKWAKSDRPESDPSGDRSENDLSQNPAYGDRPENDHRPESDLSGDRPENDLSQNPAYGDRSENDHRPEIGLSTHYPYARTQPQEPKAARLGITELINKIKAHCDSNGDRSENDLGQNPTYGDRSENDHRPESDPSPKNNDEKSPQSVGISDFSSGLIATLENFALEDYSPKDLKTSPKDLVLKTSPKDLRSQSSQSFDIYRLKSLVSDYVFMSSGTVIQDKPLLAKYLIAIFKVLFPGQRILDPKRHPVADTTSELLCISEKLEALESTLKGKVSFSWFVMYFTLMKNCPFLSGAGQQGWKCYLDWALSEQAMKKIIALEYKPNELQSGTRVKWQPKTVADYICMKLRKGEYRL